jgi:predicted PurR-regulated permease PerM
VIDLFNDRFFKIALKIILILLIIFLAGQIPYIVDPIIKVLSLVLFPLLLGGFLYYLLRPIVRFLSIRIKYKSLAILITFLLVITLIIFIIYFGGSIIYGEIRELIKYFSLNYASIKVSINKIIEFGNGKLDFLANFNLQSRAADFIQGILDKLSNYNLMGTFSSLTNFGTIIVLIPFVLFYFLKDDTKISQAIISFFADKDEKKVEKVLKEIDQVLAAYISSQLLVALLLGLAMFIGFLIIGLPNSFALALIAMITSLIPILGPTLGILPALFIATTSNWLMLVKVLIVLAISQYLEGNLIRPLIQGEKLNIHPLIVLFVVLSSILLFGVVGALFAVPAYAVARILVKNFGIMGK